MSINDQVTPELQEAVRKAMQDEFAPTAWKPREKLRYVITCPSGQKCLLKHLDTMDLIESELIEDIDFFTKRLFPVKVDGAGNLVDKQEGEEEIDENTPVWVLFRDVEKRARFHILLNRIMVAGVIRPKIIDDGVQIVKNNEGKRIVKMPAKKVELKEGEVAASSIDFIDRMHIFSELNKPLEQIKPFRFEQAAMLAGMESVQKSRSETE